MVSVRAAAVAVVAGVRTGVAYGAVQVVLRCASCVGRCGVRVSVQGDVASDRRRMQQLMCLHSLHLV